MSSMSWAAIGNVSHVLTMLVFISFAICVVQFADKKSRIFDREWVKDGFCISNANVPHWTSHDLCLYADTILAMVLGVLFYFLRREPGMKAANDLVRFNIIGILAHGVVHGLEARDRRHHVDHSSTISYEKIVSGEMLEIVPGIVGNLLFWFGLTKATMDSSSNIQVAMVSIMFFVGSLMVPRQLGFTYVQTVLLMSFSTNQLMRPTNEKKTFEYAFYPMIVGLPTGLVGWLESTMCSSFVKGIGGHLVYDAYIAVSIISFYLLSFYHTQNTTTQKIKEF